VATGDTSDEDMFAVSDDDAQPRPGTALTSTDRPGQSAPIADGGSPVPAALPGAVEAAAATGSGQGEVAAPAGAVVAATMAADTQVVNVGGAGVATSAQVADYASWPISELQRLLTEAKIDFTGVLDKEGLVERAQALDREHKEHRLPAGFALDPESGYFHNTESGWYFHVESGFYYREGKWFAADVSTGTFTEVSS
jgi:hypothetical protein